MLNLKRGFADGWIIATRLRSSSALLIPVQAGSAPWAVLGEGVLTSLDGAPHFRDAYSTPPVWEYGGQCGWSGRYDNGTLKLIKNTPLAPILTPAANQINVPHLSTRSYCLTLCKKPILPLARLAKRPGATSYQLSVWRLAAAFPLHFTHDKRRDMGELPMRAKERPSPRLHSWPVQRREGRARRHPTPYNNPARGFPRGGLCHMIMGQVSFRCIRKGRRRGCLLRSAAHAHHDEDCRPSLSRPKYCFPLHLLATLITFNFLLLRSQFPSPMLFLYLRVAHCCLVFTSTANRRLFRSPS